MNNFNLTPDSVDVIFAFSLYLVGVLALGVISHRFMQRGSFVKEYFLGNRGLGPWVLALTIAATAVSGGTFMGFPSLIYTNGWVMALWIASYMIVPLTTMALLGKRLNQVARISGAVTLPDVFRDRFQSPALGLTATIIILICLTVNLVAQFKAGGTVMMVAMQLPPVNVSLFGLQVERGYLIGLVVFAATVIGYTAYGGFWAVTWTDVLEGMVMLIGVVLLAILAIGKVPEIDGKTGLDAASERLRRINPELVTAPGPSPKTHESAKAATTAEPASSGFLPLGSAFSFFVMWSIIGVGQPGGMVRLMAFKDTPSLRRSILLVAGYYVLTYIGLLIIFICARAIFPKEYLGKMGDESRGEPDSIMPVMIRYCAPHPLIAGFLLAAPYAAIMSTVAAFLLLISSSIVRDIYQRMIRPNASNKTLKYASIGVTVIVGIVVLIGAMNPPTFLQYIIVFSTSGLGCAFAFPMALTIFWKRTTRSGAIAGMLGGVLTVFALYGLGWIDGAGRMRESLGWLPGWGQPKFSAMAPYNLAGLDPLVWGLALSCGLTVGVSLLTKPDETQMRKYFPPEGG